MSDIQQERFAFVRLLIGQNTVAGQMRAVALAPWNAEVLEVSVVPLELWRGTKKQERRQLAKIPQRSSLGDSKVFAN